MLDHRHATDEDVVRLVRNGDTSAFGELVDRYKDKALSLSIRLLKHEQDAEDALQDAFIKAYKALSSFRADATFATWFYRIVYTTCLNVLKRRSRAQLHIELDDNYHGDDTAYVNTELLDSALVDAVIREELMAMPSLYAAIMDLFYIQERSYEEIVFITGLPLGTVKTRLNRGRLALQKAVFKKIPELESWTNK